MLAPAVLSSAERRLLDEARRLIADAPDGFDKGVLDALKHPLLAEVPFDRLGVLVDDEGHKTFRLLWLTTSGHAPETSYPASIPVPDALRAVDEGSSPDPHVVEDMDGKNSVFAGIGRSAGIKSCVLFRLVHDGQRLGWMYVAHDVKGAPSRGRVALLTELAHVFAAGVARSRITARYRLFASLVGESPDGMLALDAAFHVKEANAAALQMLDLTREQIVGRPLEAVVGEVAASLLARNLSQGARSSIVPVELSLGPGRRPTDAVVARVSGTLEASVQIHLRDARSRKLVEEATTRRVEQLAFLRALGEVMANDLRADKALARAVDLCFVRFELGALCALRADGLGSLRLAAAHGVGPLLRAALSSVTEAEIGRVLFGGSSSFGLGIGKTRGLVELPAVRFPDDPSDAPARWVVVAPLVHARRRLGCLILAGDPGREASAGDREIWESVANTISVGLHAADDFERVVALEAEKRQLVDNLPVVVARLDPQSGTTLFVNGAVERVLGVPIEDAMGTPGVQGLLADAIERDASRAARDRAAAGGTMPWQDRRYRHKDGRVLTLREYVYPVLDSGRNVHAIEVIAYDITTEVDARKQLMQSDRLASLGALAAGIAHEINNPVAFISLASGQIGRLIDQLRRDDPQAEERLRELAQEINEGATRIADIVGELKLFTRIPDGAHSTPVDINRILQTAITLTSAEIKRRAQLDLDLGELPLAPGAFVGLGQAFVNLLINAAQAIESKEAGAWAHSSGADYVQVKSRLRDGAIVVTVRDTGVGIEPAHISRIFDPFFKTRAEGQGTGLGLAIAYDLVRRVGGDIRVESAKGQGTSFGVVLPLEPSPDSVRDESPPSTWRKEGASEGRASRVLLIDDEPQVVRTMAKQLVGGFSVDAAPTASAALAQLGVRSYDAVVCDLRMADQSGPAIYDAIRARSPEQASRFIFVTGASVGLGDDEILLRAQATGLPVLEKPVEPKLLLAAVSRAASRRP